MRSQNWGLPSDAEPLPEWRNFQFAPKNHYGFFFLHNLPLTIAFRLEYVLFYQFYAKITTFFSVKKNSVQLLSYIDVEMFGGNWHENDVKTSKLSYWCHAWESSYTPHVKQHFTKILVGYARMNSLHTSTTMIQGKRLTSAQLPMAPKFWAGSLNLWRKCPYTWR